MNKKARYTTGIGTLLLALLLVTVGIVMQEQSPTMISSLPKMLSNRVDPISAHAPCPTYGTTLTRSATAVDTTPEGWVDRSTTMTATFVYGGDCLAPTVVNPTCSQYTSFLADDVHITHCAASQSVMSNGNVLQAAAEDDASFLRPSTSFAPATENVPLTVHIAADQYGNITVNVHNQAVGLQLLGLF